TDGWISGDQGGFNLKNIKLYYTMARVNVNVGVTEEQNYVVGSLSSAVINLLGKAYFGKVFVDHSNGYVGVKVRGGNQADLNDAKDFTDCTLLQDDDDIERSGCVKSGNSYLQYQVLLSSPLPGVAQLTSVGLQYQLDNVAPDAVTSLTVRSYKYGSVVAEGGWFTKNSYFSWEPSSDNQDGSGILGYCLYLGTDPNATFTESLGILAQNKSDVSSDCLFTTSKTDYTQTYQGSGFDLEDGSTYYFKVAPIDRVGNIGQETTTFMVADSEGPVVMSNFSFPSGRINSKEFDFTWAGPPIGQVYENGSGLTGLRYCIYPVLPYEDEESYAHCMGAWEEDDDQDMGVGWIGANGTSSYALDTNNTIPFNQEQVHVGPEAAQYIDDGISGGYLGDGVGVNVIHVIALDNAGNASIVAYGYIFISKNPPSSPRNLQVNPTASSVNNFSFSWVAPSDFSGAPSSINYCYSVNQPIEADQSNCNWTGPGITQLAAGPYATQQGVNTLYVAAKDQAGNFDASTAVSVTFTATTSAPGAPTNLDLSDVSTRATSTWKLASSWTTPTQTGSGIASYRIYRSTDNVNFTQVASVSPSNLSFIDNNLSQLTYYYYVRACDNAGNCGVPSNVVSKKPTGRFTEPANLTHSGSPKVSNIGSKKATINWTTDRDSDSKVAIGTSPGQYQPQEIGNSLQQPDHKVDLTNLEPNTTYYYVAKWTDTDGNTGTS
ncbi:fibronectin type III domain-containing protein, partial [Candidatus Saccharibacteria bacterium]|nr:fibronectin type III domain-containing protein [Candidatus Saccharibacteria bacterium]